jgi:hypothetical protein
MMRAADGAGGKSNGEAETESFFSSGAIADLYPAATVMYADIAGFTAWSSVRDPSQVFALLEVVYNAFDAIAKKRKVFKVETIGDTYVCVAGVPGMLESSGFSFKIQIQKLSPLLIFSYDHRTL